MFKKVILAATVCALVCALALGFVPHGPADGNPNPGIIPPHATPHGQTYGEWTAAWWQWALSIPADRNPLLTSGEFCGEGQSGPVWFYAGNFGWDEEKFCTVPKGKALFMPVYNWIFGAAVWDCEPSVPGVPCVVEDLREAAAAAVCPVVRGSAFCFRHGIPMNVGRKRDDEAASEHTFPMTSHSHDALKQRCDLRAFAELLRDRVDKHAPIRLFHDPPKTQCTIL